MKTLIYGGLVVDPASRTHERKNILIEDGKIREVTSGEPQAEERIDAGGRIVCPGFIDIHMHEDPVGPDGAIVLDEDVSIFACMLRMGVTTAIGGNCGSNAYDPVAYLNLVDRDGAPVNVGMLAGHNYFREQVGCGGKYASATFEQIAAIGWCAQMALDGGCMGISYGIRYAPGMDLWEMMASARACAGAGGLAAAHIRDDADQVFGAAEEFLEIGRTLGIPLEISHIGSMAGFGQMERFLKLVDKWKADGVDVSCDCYPYDAFCTEIGATTYDEGWLERYHCGYDAVEICEGKYKGQRLNRERFEEMRREHPEYLTVAHVMRAEEIEMALSHPNVMLGSDGILDRGQGHPRAAGAFPRLLSRFCKIEEKGCGGKSGAGVPAVGTGKMSLDETIAKMTIQPANRLGLTNKGRLTPGADADIVIVDPDTLADRATFAEPLLAPVGIDRVLIGGRTAMEAGRIVNGRLGRAVRKR